MFRQVAICSVFYRYLSFCRLFGFGEVPVKNWPKNDFLGLLAVFPSNGIFLKNRPDPCRSKS